MVVLKSFLTKNVYTHKKYKKQTSNFYSDVFYSRKKH